MEECRDGRGGPPSVYLEHFGSNALTDLDKQEIEGNQTLVDWLVESGGFGFDPQSTVERDSKEEGKAGRKYKKLEGGGHIYVSGQWPANLLMQFPF